ncbi:unnamed protein product [Lasius platythorax]|uniref:Uncharacterized protein n=1 Tax=Lasius platythorax TaxID=488582 RepID=A0AAV2NXY2_9HYME
MRGERRIEKARFQPFVRPRGENVARRGDHQRDRPWKKGRNEISSAPKKGDADARPKKSKGERAFSKSDRAFRV